MKNTNSDSLRRAWGPHACSQPHPFDKTVFGQVIFIFFEIGQAGPRILRIAT